MINFVTRWEGVAREIALWIRAKTHNDQATDDNCELCHLLLYGIDLQDVLVESNALKLQLRHKYSQPRCHSLCTQLSDFSPTVPGDFIRPLTKE